MDVMEWDGPPVPTWEPRRRHVHAFTVEPGQC